MPLPDIAGYARHSRWSDPGPFAAELETLPADPAALPEVVGGLVLHPFFAPKGTDRAEASLRSAPELLAALFKRDPRPLDQTRAPDKRIVGTCRSYALLACAILRQHGVPVRLRVGFADYFITGFWEDHWVCEYHDGSAWRVLDAELRRELRARLRIEFSAAEVPPGRFLPAGPAWLALRAGEHDPARFGVSLLGIGGLAFVAGSLLRDLAALTMEELMPWDYWGPARNFKPGADIRADWLFPLDSLATALARAPALYSEARDVLAAHPWAALTPSILSFPDGKPVEVALDPR